jgi:hypothetical protein
VENWRRFKVAALSLEGEEDSLIGYLHLVELDFLSSLSSPNLHISLEEDGCGAGELRCPKWEMGLR